MKTFYQITPTKHGWNYGYGFFSNYRVCLEQLIDHFETKKQTIPYINWDKTTWIESFNPFESTEFKESYNPFDFWFDQEIPTTDDQIIECKSGLRPDLIDHAKDYFDEPESLAKQKYVDKLYIKLNKNIQNKIDQIYDEELKGHTVLGVVARGAEYNFHHPMYGIFNIDHYIDKIRNILAENLEITKLFVVSEDIEYVEKIYSYFPNSFFMKNVFRRTDETLEYMNRVHCWPNVSNKRFDHCKLLGEETIIQTKLLGKCDYIMGRHSGVFTGAILWGENIKKIFKI